MWKRRKKKLVLAMCNESSTVYWYNTTWYNTTLYCINHWARLRKKCNMSLKICQIFLSKNMNFSQIKMSGGVKRIFNN